MQELFYEETVNVQDEKKHQKKYNTLRIISIIFYVLTGAWILFAYMFGIVNLDNLALDIILLFLPAVFFLLLGIFFGYFKNKFYNEFDYSFVSGNIRISKIIANRKRKLLYKFDTKDIEKVGYYDSETYNNYQKSPGVKSVYLTSNHTPADGKDFFYIVANVKNGKKLMLLECSRTMIRSIIKFAGITVLERGFK